MKETRVTQAENLPQIEGELLSKLGTFGEELMAIAKKYGVRLMIAAETEVGAPSPFKHKRCKGGLRIVARPGLVRISSDGGANMEVEELRPPSTKKT